MLWSPTVPEEYKTIPSAFCMEHQYSLNCVGYPIRSFTNPRGDFISSITSCWISFMHFSHCMEYHHPFHILLYGTDKIFKKSYRSKALRSE